MKDLKQRAVRRMGLPLFCLMMPTLLLLAACASPRARVAQVPVQAEVVQSAVRFRKEYILAPGDHIEVVVRKVPEASRGVVLRPDGFISLPLIQDVQAAGLTTRELVEKLTQLFSTRLVEPEVNVIPVQVRQPMVYVVGDVTVPSAVPFREAPTAMQAISMVGGLRKSGAARDVTILRVTEDGFLRAIPVTASVGGQPGPYMALRSTVLMPDDIVFVPENGRSQVSRFYDEVLARPLLGLNQILGTYLNFRLVQQVTR